MRDCPNTRVRELLPDLLHDRLSDAARAEVRAHLDLCEACRAELELLRRVRAATAAPRVDASRIAAAVPPYRARAPWRRLEWPQLRAAAAIVLLAGGAAVATILSRDTVENPAVTNRTDSPAVAVYVPMPGKDTAPPPRRARGTAPAELAVGETLTDLSDSELRVLLETMNGLDAVTPDESDVVVPSLPRAGRTGSSGDA